MPLIKSGKVVTNLAANGRRDQSEPDFSTNPNKLMIFLPDCTTSGKLDNAVFYAALEKTDQRINLNRTLMRLSLIFFLIFLGCLTLSASDSKGQEVNITVNAKPLETVLKQIEKQTGYLFFFKAASLKKSRPVTVNIKDASLKTALDKIFAEQPFAFEIIGETIVVKDKPTPEPKISDKKTVQTINGNVNDENGKPLAGANITVKGTSRTTVTDVNGNFKLVDIGDNAVLTISYIGYTTQELKAVDGMTVSLAKGTSSLDEVQVIAYGTSSKRLNTGSVASITAADIAKQPVSNPLAALSGRMPGLEVTQSSGVTGSSYSLIIRGRNSIAQGSEPLILIDGIPFSAQNQALNVLPSAISQQGTASLSPFFTINPSDIDRIDVLKDADATAIYGSRGANGVILITTKKGQVGKTKVSLNFSRGMSKAPEGMEMMNTEQYLIMRKEAFLNSNATPTNATAPDLLVWDQNRNTNVADILTGNTGQLLNAQLSLSGGSENISFLFGGGYYRETSIYPTAIPNDRGNANLSLTHISNDKKFTTTLSSNFTSSKNQAPLSDLTQFISLAPNVPNFYNETGGLNWSEGGAEFDNPLGSTINKYKAISNNFSSSLNTAYKLFPFLSIKLLAGFNQISSTDFLFSPRTAYAPSSTSAVNRSQFGTNNFTTWNVEPQLESSIGIWKGKLNVLAGGTFNQRKNNQTFIVAEGFSTEALMSSLQAASVISARTNSNTLYRYQAIFARANYNLFDKYILNITGRRDGSSRFGPGKQFANFGAVGAAYIFSEERTIKESLPFVSFGKLRASYGITGNDQIGDYQYLDSWAAYSSTYDGNPTLDPQNLFNASYSWETNKKLEYAIDLGFVKDRILLSANYFQNRSSNQLVAYKLPYQTGFAGIIRNFPALVENTGWEFQLSATPFANKRLNWSTSINVTIPKNKLLSFPEIESSSYASRYIVGKSLNVVRAYASPGVDPTTGLLTYNDNDGNNTLNYFDYLVAGDLDPKYYGGWNNSLSYSNFELTAFIDFRKQIGRDFTHGIYSSSKTAGTLNNQPVALLNRWTATNTNAAYEKYQASTPANRANYTLSELAYSDQSFIRLRSVELSYKLPQKFISKIKASQARIFAQAQNLITWSKTKGYNPETQSIYRTAPLQVFNTGVQLIF